MRDDIYGGLKNAVERGEDLEKAVQSFISAGYSEQDVRQVAQAMSGAGADHNAYNKPNQQGYSSPQSRMQAHSQFPNNYKKPAKFDWKLLTLASVLLILLAVLVFSVFFKEQIIEFFSNII